MPRPFEALCERLLRAGIAPRHVRRYERELGEHLDDLTAMQKCRGYDDEDAAIRARALLGTDDELADAMTACKQFRSLAARLPWLVFALAPPVLAAALLLSCGLTMAGALYPFFHGRPLPSNLIAAVDVLCRIFNILAGPMAAVFFVILAVRQHLPWRWPVIAVGVVALFSAFTVFIVHLPSALDTHLEVGVGLAAYDTTLWQNAARFCLTAVIALVATHILRSRRTTV
ncbi:MAG: hypothetical protein WCA81_16470 [Rhizomicrobium sp.]